VIVNNWKQPLVLRSQGVFIADAQNSNEVDFKVVNPFPSTGIIHAGSGTVASPIDRLWISRVQQTTV
jgi:hypothetical protein